VQGVRASMAELIDRVRGLIGDPAGASEQFNSQAIQDALDRRRRDVRSLELAYGETIQPGGAVAYLDYYAPGGLTDWEADAALQYGGTWAAVTPASSDWLAGHWTFASSQPPAVYLTGKTYDVYAAAADLLERWAATVARAYDFDEDGQRFRRSQQREGLLAVAAQYRAQQRPAVGSMARSDLNAAGW
jgi:hypothetical protein